MLFVTDRTLGQLVWSEGQIRPWQPLHHLAPDTQVALDPTGRWLAMVVHRVGQTHLEIWSVAPWQHRHRVTLPEGMVPWKLLFFDPRASGGCMPSGGE
ncbi:MAG: hypothetical protein HC860_19725 [Alkalinema sp. RU_4_3]|nr:hypothetical protein [Alkalinema sp. RU_4_3]